MLGESSRGALFQFHSCQLKHWVLVYRWYSWEIFQLNQVLFNKYDFILLYFLLQLGYAQADRSN